MANNDYFVVIFKVLSYFYNQKKNGKEIKEENINAYKLQVNQTYLMDIYKELFEEGYLKGGHVRSYMDGSIQLDNFEDIRITIAGVEFLKENNQMKKS
ncbi:YjcQ protein [Eremococcus coleocola]|uniref:YjcQ protein n=1 Tax=Eremococcus coleocola ACS-139-V-Col8 TaxID=908337 RepID=E4KQ92_9LACT|nr:YjcQ protein [Eremococcus coleocola]EFR30824.1 YjcQ protein [Eremococcus coleocola ACS-139-V-Col8]